MQAGSSLIEQLNTYRPTKVLAFEASDALLIKLVTVVGTGLLFFVDQVYS